MSKNNKNAAQQPKKEAPKAPKAPKQAPAAPKVEKKEEKVEEAQVIVANAMNPEKILNNSRRGGLSPDATVQALDLAHRVFVEERDPDLQFPKETAIKVNKIVAIGILCTLADHASNGDDSFATVLNTQAYPSLASAAEDLGFKMPDIKMLPAGSAPGTVMLPASQVEIPEEAKEELKKEKEIREGEKPELDPEKITSEEDLKKALQYMFAQRSNKLVDTLVNGIDFMKKFRLHEASLAENADEAKAKFEAYNSGDWLNDLFSYVQPTVFFNGIGRGMASVIASEKDPVHAFCIFRDAIRDKASKQPVLSDQEIAYAVKSIVTWVCNVNIKSNEKAIDALDKKKNAKEIAECTSRVEYYNSIIECITDPTTDNVDVMIENMGNKFDDGGALTPECQKANSIFNIVCKTYYGKPLSCVDYKNLDTNVQNYAGKIINLFRNSGAKVMKYSDAIISDLEERSDEEKAELTKALKKEWAEKKAASKTEEQKNA